MLKAYDQENQTNIAGKMQHNLKCIKTLLCCEACDGVADTIVMYFDEELQYNSKLFIKQLLTPYGLTH